MFQNKQRQNMFLLGMRKTFSQKRKTLSDYFNARITTMCIDEKHLVQEKDPVHNHTPETSRLTVEIV